MKRSIKCAIAAVAALAALLSMSAAQQGITRMPLGTIDFPPGYQTVMGYAIVPANTCVERHIHPGIETTYVLEGEELLRVAGQPEKKVKGGDSFQVPAGVPHEGCTSSTAAKFVTVHVVEKGKPLASPAP
jgi:quercetin dioxygenase-like cupin family protein